MKSKLFLIGILILRAVCINAQDNWYDSIKTLFTGKIVYIDDKGENVIYKKDNKVHELYNIASKEVKSVLPFEGTMSLNDNYVFDDSCVFWRTWNSSSDYVFELWDLYNAKLITNYIGDSTQTLDWFIKNCWDGGGAINNGCVDYGGGFETRTFCFYLENKKIEILKDSTEEYFFIIE